QTSARSHFTVRHQAAEVLERTPDELDHAKALEAKMDYYERLDVVLCRAIGRRDNALNQFKEHRDFGRQLRRLSDEIAEVKLHLRIPRNIGRIDSRPEILAILDQVARQKELEEEKRTAKTGHENELREKDGSQSTQQPQEPRTDDVRGDGKGKS